MLHQKRKEEYLRPEEPHSTAFNVSVAKGDQVADDDGKPEGGALEDGVGHPKLGNIKGANAQVKQGV